MGGEDTGVTDTTRHVLLESAYFLALERSTHGAGIESAERCQLSL